MHMCMQMFVCKYVGIYALYVYTYKHKCLHTYVHTYIHMYILTYIQIYVRTYLPTFIQMYSIRIHSLDICINYANKHE